MRVTMPEQSEAEIDSCRRSCRTGADFIYLRQAGRVWKSAPPPTLGRWMQRPDAIAGRCVQRDCFFHPGVLVVREPLAVKVHGSMSIRQMMATRRRSSFEVDPAISVTRPLAYSRGGTRVLRLPGTGNIACVGECHGPRDGKSPSRMTDGAHIAHLSDGFTRCAYSRMCRTRMNILDT